MSILARAHSFAEWRNAARGLLRRHVAPYEVQWQTQGANDDLFGHAPARMAAALPGSVASPSPALSTQASIRAAAIAGGSPLHITRSILAMFENAAACRDGDRWAFLYRVLWRWSAGEHSVLSPADADGMRLHAMIRTANREAHRIIETLRFLERPLREGAPRLVAWCDPAHDVLPRVAEHFSRRMAGSTWLIATPQGAAMWDGRALHFDGPVAAGPADLVARGTALWPPASHDAARPADVSGGTAASCGDRSVARSPVPAPGQGMLALVEPVPAVSPPAAIHGVAPVRIDLARKGADEEHPAPLAQCRRCELWRRATQAVPGVGPQDARLMLIGDQPGEIDDIAGKPFVGPAGRVLNTALQQAGIERGAVYLTHAVKHFKAEPRGMRRMQKPLVQQEIDACGAWLDHELALVAPKVIVALGEGALRALLKTTKVRFGEVLNRPIEAGGRWIVATHHPAAVQRLFNPKDKERALSEMVDGLRLAQRLAEGRRAGDRTVARESRVLFA